MTNILRFQQQCLQCVLVPSAGMAMSLKSPALSTSARPSARYSGARPVASHRRVASRPRCP